MILGLEGNARKRVISKDASLSISMVSATIVENPSTPLRQRYPLRLLLLSDSCNPHHFCPSFLISLTIKYIQTRTQLIFYVTFQSTDSKIQRTKSNGMFEYLQKEKIHVKSVLGKKKLHIHLYLGIGQRNKSKFLEFSVSQGFSLLCFVNLWKRTKASLSDFCWGGVVRKLDRIQGVLWKYTIKKGLQKEIKNKGKGGFVGSSKDRGPQWFHTSISVCSLFTFSCKAFFPVDSRTKTIFKISHPKAETKLLYIVKKKIEGKMKLVKNWVMTVTKLMIMIWEQ